MERAGASADLLEIRADYIRDPDLGRIIAAGKKPLIITVSPKQEQGKFTGTEEERIALLMQAIELGAEHIDVNFGCPATKDIIAGKKDTKVIVSYHNFEETPSDLDGIYTAIKETGADIIKIATCATKLSDNIRMCNLVKQSDTPTIALCMGPLGEISRILTPLYGAYLTFASQEQGRESAPGQIPADVVKNIYAIGDVKPGFKIFGLVGDPVNKSKGYVLYNRLFRHYGVNSIYVNLLVRDIDDFIDNVHGALAGYSVTMPHKQAVTQYLDAVDPAAARIGAVNAIVNRDGTCTGYNTDMPGAIQAIEEKTGIRHKNTTILGAGGAARALAVGVLDKGGKVTILNRTAAKSAQLAEALRCTGGPLADFGSVPTDILINTTSAGMQPDTDMTPVDTRLVKNMVVFDAIYNPAKTKLLQEAERNGCTVISGMDMFINQAIEQFTLWTDITPDRNLIRETLQCAYT